VTNILDVFFDGQTEEEAKARQDAANKASTEAGSLALKVSGQYLMEVGTFAYPDKKDEKKKKMLTSPMLKLSETTNSLMLVISLKVVDGTPQAPKGSSIMTNIVLSPAKGAGPDTLEKTMKFMKPKISALTGEENITIDAKWIEEWLIPKFEDKDGKYELIKDHKMKKKVMVVIEDDFYNNKPTLKVTQIRKATAGEKSVSNKETTVPEDSGQNIDRSIVDEDVVQNDINPESAVIDAPIADIPEPEEF